MKERNENRSTAILFIRVYDCRLGTYILVPYLNITKCGFNLLYFFFNFVIKKCRWSIILIDIYSVRIHYNSPWAR